MSATTSTILDPDRLLQAIVDVTKERLGVYHVHIYVADESLQPLLLAAGADKAGRQMVAENHAIAMNVEKSLVARQPRTAGPDRERRPRYVDNSSPDIHRRRITPPASRGQARGLSIRL